MRHYLFSDIEDNLGKKKKKFALISVAKGDGMYVFFVCVY